MCDRIVSYPTERRVLILQHPQEQDAVLGSAQILTASLPKAKIVVGLSWPNFAKALGEEGVDSRRWAVLFPDREAQGEQVTGRAGITSPTALEGIVVLDGTWSKAKTLWWRNPWLSKLNRLTLKPKQPSIYGHLRAEHEPQCQRQRPDLRRHGRLFLLVQRNLRLPLRSCLQQTSLFTAGQNSFLDRVVIRNAQPLGREGARQPFHLNDRTMGEFTRSTIVQALII